MSRFFVTFHARLRILGKIKIGTTRISVRMRNLSRIPLIERAKNRPSGCPAASEIANVRTKTKTAGDTAFIIL